MSAISNEIKNQHLLWRAGFGPKADTINPSLDISTKNLYTQLVKTSRVKPESFNTATNILNGVTMEMHDAGAFQKLRHDERKILGKQSIDDLKSLNLLWLSQMVNSEAQLREKMSLFWHGHFACRVVNIYFQQQLINIIRENSLGNFGNLLRQVSKSAAMLSFLNNQQNKKQNPNENFAREVMELFTIGRGNYTESDVKEGARSFTGWGFNLEGEFVDRPFLHDNDKKTFFGKTGNFNGDDIITILLEQKETARFITQKVFKYFVNDAPDNATIQWLADRFYQSNYDIQTLMTDIFTSDWFFHQKNIGTHIKSPVEFIVGIQRFIPMKIEKPETQLLFERALGQVLFYPPNVAGWPGGKNWIDSSSLMFRMRIPQILANADDFLLRTKDDDDTMMGMQENEANRRMRRVNVSIDWDPVLTIFNKTPKEKLVQRISSMVLQTKNKINTVILDEYVEKSARDVYIKSTILELMSTPEYQLC